METGKYTLHRLALRVLQQLGPEEQAQVRESLTSLLALPVHQWPALQARRLPGDPPLYLVRLDDTFRAFVQAAEGQPPEVRWIELPRLLRAPLASAETVLGSERPADWQLGAVHHVGLTVSDLGRSIRFYRDVLGLRLLAQRTADADYVGRQIGCPGVRLEVASFQLGTAGRPTLELAQYLSGAGDNSPPATNCAGQAHLCFEVDDIHRAYEALRAQGVRFRSEPIAITAGPNRGGFVVYLYDPDGFTIELFEPAQRETGDPAYDASRPGRLRPGQLRELL
jgi:catechol 2,3-dioxygenase-like lactoylglutathione lyase family enzyme